MHFGSRQRLLVVKGPFQYTISTFLTHAFSMLIGIFLLKMQNTALRFTLV